MRLFIIGGREGTRVRVHGFAGINIHHVVSVRYLGVRHHFHDGRMDPVDWRIEVNDRWRGRCV
jgi:hypothetical protein